MHWRSLGQVGALFLAACATPPSKTPSTDGVDAYEVIARDGANVLDVTARFSGGFGGLAIGDGALRFARDVRVNGAPAKAVDGGFDASACRAAACVVRYQFALGAAADAIEDVERAERIGDVLAAPPSTFLLRPARGEGDAELRLHVVPPEGRAFAAGLARGDSADSYRGRARDLPGSAFAAFGPLRRRSIAITSTNAVGRVAVSEVEVALATPAVQDDAILGWVAASARAIAGYFGRFPQPRSLVLALPAAGDSLARGETMGDGTSAIVVHVGQRATASRLVADWVLPHEMIHLAFPTMPRKHHWLEEGMATYVEPIARARVGGLAVDEVWRGLIEGLPQGLPEPGDQGLDETPTWGRTYWGGALYCLLADIEARTATKGARSLDDGFRGVLDAGGDGGQRWPIDRALSEGDQAIGSPVLLPLYAKMAAAPAPVNLAALFRDLGVRLEGERVVYDDAAPLAPIRRAITSKNPRDASVTSVVR
jgi:hypothetical protein